MRDRCLQSHLVEFAYEEVAVLRVHDGFDRGAQHLNAILLEHARLIKLRATVQRRLSTESQEDAVGAFLLDNFGYEKGRHRLKVNFVGNALRRLDSGDVWID